MTSRKSQAHSVAVRVAIISLILNLILSVAKVVTGGLLDNLAIISDGAHGFGDMLTTVIALVTVLIAAKIPDPSHNSGYKRFGSIGSLVLSVILMMVSLTILTSAIEGLVTCDYSRGEKKEVDELFIVTITILSVSILAKETMYHLMRYGAKITSSDVMRADAWHQRIDALSSVGAIGGLLGTLYGINFLDPLFSILIVFMIAHIAVEILNKGIKELSGQALEDESLKRIKSVFSSHHVEITGLKTYIEGSVYRIQAQISCPVGTAVSVFQALVEELKKDLKEAEPMIDEITIEPAPPPLEEKV